jgi:DNA-binding XRE family transcriptional regulator
MAGLVPAIDVLPAVIGQRRVRTTLGRRVKDLRLSLKMTQADLADEAEIRRALVSEIERGEATGNFLMIAYPINCYSRFSPCGDVNFVARSSSPSIVHFLRSLSMSPGQRHLSVSAPFVRRCLTGSTMSPFSHPPGRRRRSPAPGSHRTWRADFPHHALRQLVHSFHCYLFKFRFHGQLIFSLSRRP